MTSRFILALNISEFQFGTFRMSMLPWSLELVFTVCLRGLYCQLVGKVPRCYLKVVYCYQTFCIFICKTLISNVISVSFECTTLCLVSFCIRIPVSPTCLAFDLSFLMNVQFLKIITRLVFNLVSQRRSTSGLCFSRHSSSDALSSFVIRKLIFIYIMINLLQDIFSTLLTPTILFPVVRVLCRVLPRLH